MFRTAFPAGKILGVDLRIHLSFPILLVLATGYAAVSTGNAMRGLGLWAGLVLAVAVREVARAVAAAYAGLQLRALFLLPIGGVMAFAPRPPDEREPSMLPVTLAGPLANFFAGLFLLGACYALVPGIHLFDQPWIGTRHVLRSFVFLQFTLAVLGLLPSTLPGRPVLKPRKRDAEEAASPTTGAATGASTPAFNVGTILALGTALVGILLMNPWLICLGGFFFLAAQFGSPTQQALASPAAEFIRVRDVMLTEYTPLSASDTLAGALEQSVHSMQDVFPVVRGDRLVGSIARSTLVEQFQREGNAYLQGIMTRNLPLASPEETLIEALRRAAALGASEFIPVVDDGALIGILTPQSLSRAVQLVRKDRPQQRAQADE